jgi:hypothetical protein
LIFNIPQHPLSHGVNFRDEKTILGVGEAQVRKKEAVQKVPALAVAAYATLLALAIHTFGHKGLPDTLRRSF